MKETKVILRWLLNTRSLTISPPLDKHKFWVSDINLMICAPQVKHKHLETTIGQLNHVAGIYSPMCYFLGCLYQAQFRASTSSWTGLIYNEKMDLHLMISFLDQASQGISMNLLTFRKPTNIYHSNASEFGIGGYNIATGNTWQFELPLDCHFRTSLNLLEFISCVITIWVDMFSSQIKAISCLLCQTDSSTASRWLRKSNVADKTDEVVQLTTAHQLASIIIQTNLLSSSFPEQAPFGLKILHFPTVIFLADLSAVQSAAKGAVVEGTNTKKVHAWNRYKQYLFSIRLQDDLYLNNFRRTQT